MLASFPGVEVEAGCRPRSPGSLEQCEEHGEILSMFCVDELEPVCRECGEAGSHAGHRVYPLAEAVTDCKGELKTSLESLQKRVEKIDQLTQTCERALKHNQVQAVKTEGQVKEEFEELHRFLREEAESRLAALREESEKRRERATERLFQLVQTVEFLDKNINEIEEDMETEVMDELVFLQGTMKKYKDCVAVTMPERERRVCGPMIDVAKHLGNVRHTIWDKMKDIAPYTPVTLDPRTACPSLRLSPGLNSVQASPQEDLTQGLNQDDLVPANPERFHPYSCLLAQEGYTSGTHCWEVEVGDSSNWTVGIAGQSLQRRAEFDACPEAGLWAIGLRDGEYRAMTTPSKILSLDNMHSLRRIGISLDWDRGRLDLMHADTGENLFTFTHRFTEKVYPYFESVCAHGGLVVLPQKVNVSLEPDPIPDEDASHSALVDHIPAKKDVNKSANTTDKTQTQKKAFTDKGKFVVSEKGHAIAKKYTRKKNTEMSSLICEESTHKTKHNMSYHVSLNRYLKAMEQVQATGNGSCSLKEHQSTGTTLIS